LNNTKSKLEE